jgi:Short C-terminal domain
MKKFVITTIVLLTGCASSGVIPMGQDTFMISKQSSTGFHSAGSVKADIYKEGSAYCASQGKEFQPVNDHGVDGVPGRSFASAEVQFRCLTKGDAELRRPTMKPIPNIRIENDIREKKEITVQGTGDMYTELKKLKELLDAGIITPAEFDAQKKKIMGK